MQIGPSGPSRKSILISIAATDEHDNKETTRWLKSTNNCKMRTNLAEIDTDLTLKIDELFRHECMILIRKSYCIVLNRQIIFANN